METNKKLQNILAEFLQNQRVILMEIRLTDKINTSLAFY
jgi:hypothetical protein